MGPGEAGHSQANEKMENNVKTIKMENNVETIKIADGAEQDVESNEKDETTMRLPQGQERQAISSQSGEA